MNPPAAASARRGSYGKLAKRGPVGAGGRASGGVSTIACLLFAPLAEMQAIVREILDDLGLTFLAAQVPASPTTP
jgi:hypothetical protein